MLLSTKETVLTPLFESVLEQLEADPSASEGKLSADSLGSGITAAGRGGSWLAISLMLSAATK